MGCQVLRLRMVVHVQCIHAQGLGIWLVHLAVIPPAMNLVNRLVVA